MGHHQKKMRERKSRGQIQIAPRCKYCGFKTHQNVIKAAFWTVRGLIIIEDITVWLCDGCGEQLFEKTITQRVQQVVTNPMVRPKRRIWISVYSLSELGIMHEDHSTGHPEQGYTSSFETAACWAKRANKPGTVNEELKNTFLCTYCDSQTIENIVKSVFWIDSEPIVVEGIRAKVCKRCGQQFYDDETVERIATLETSWFGAATVNNKMLVPIFCLTDVKGLPAEHNHSEKDNKL